MRQFHPQLMVQPCYIFFIFLNSDKVVAAKAINMDSVWMMKSIMFMHYVHGEGGGEV